MNEFTAIECMIVIAIIGILGALTYGAYKGHGNRTEEAKISWDCAGASQESLLSYEKACMTNDTPRYCQIAAKKRLCKRVETLPGGTSPGAPN